jgi:hypothetical protein
MLITIDRKPYIRNGIPDFKIFLLKILLLKILSVSPFGMPDFRVFLLKILSVSPLNDIEYSSSV